MLVKQATENTSKSQRFIMNYIMNFPRNQSESDQNL